MLPPPPPPVSNPAYVTVVPLALPVLPAAPAEPAVCATVFPTIPNHFKLETSAIVIAVPVAEAPLEAPPAPPPASVKLDCISTDPGFISGYRHTYDIVPF